MDCMNTPQSREQDQTTPVQAQKGRRFVLVSQTAKEMTSYQPTDTNGPEEQTTQSNQKGTFANFSMLGEMSTHTVEARSNVMSERTMLGQII